MQMTKQELTEHTIAVWQKRTPHQITAEDARAITENITGFFAILAEWSRKECHDPGVETTERDHRRMGGSR